MFGGLEAFSISIVQSVISSLLVLFFGSFDISPERKADAAEVLIQGSLTALRATSAKVTYDPIKRDIANGRVIFSNVKIIVPTNPVYFSESDLNRCFGTATENFIDKCSANISIKELSVNNLGNSNLTKKNIEFEIKGLSADINSYFSTQFPENPFLSEMVKIIGNNPMKGNFKIGFGYDILSDNLSFALTTNLENLAAISFASGVSNIKYTDEGRLYGDGAFSFDLNNFELTLTDDGLRPYIDFHLKNNIGIELNSGILLMLAASIEDDKKGSLGDLQNMKYIANFIDGNTKKLSCRRDKSIPIDIELLKFRGYLDNPASMIGIICQRFSNHTY